MPNTKTCIHNVMQIWQQHVSKGNQAFDSCQFSYANLFYADCLTALEQVEAEIESDSPPPDAWIVDQYIPAVVVSYLNLVDSNIAQQNINNACDLLVEGYKSVCKCAAHIFTSTQSSHQLLVLKHLSQLKHHCFVLLKQYGDDANIASKLNTIMNTISAQNNTIH